MILRFKPTDGDASRTGEYWRVIECGDCIGYAQKLWEGKQCSL